MTATFPRAAYPSPPTAGRLRMTKSVAFASLCHLGEGARSPHTRRRHAAPPPDVAVGRAFARPSPHPGHACSMLPHAINIAACMIPPGVVPADAGTHTPCRQCCTVRLHEGYERCRSHQPQGVWVPACAGTTGPRVYKSTTSRPRKPPRLHKRSSCPEGGIQFPIRLAEPATGAFNQPVRCSDSSRRGPPRASVRAAPRPD
jgi:hypothetical protein